MTDRIDVELRRLIAEILRLHPDDVLSLPPQTPLLSGDLGLSSRGGARLLVAVRDRFGVDVAAEDLALRSLESLGTLADLIRSRQP